MSNSLEQYLFKDWQTIKRKDRQALPRVRWNWKLRRKVFAVQQTPNRNIFKFDGIYQVLPRQIGIFKSKCLMFDYDVSLLVSACYKFRRGRHLYQIIKEEVQKHVTTTVLPKMKSVEAKNFYFALADDWKRYKEVNKKLDGLVSNKKKFFRTDMEIYRNEFLFEEEILKKYSSCEDVNC